ncbi:hypothetical protein AWENTII_003701 [Aspergillus wentii]
MISIRFTPGTGKKRYKPAYFSVSASSSTIQLSSTIVYHPNQQITMKASLLVLGLSALASAAPVVDTGLINGDIVDADVSALNHRDVIDADAKALNHRDVVDADVSALNHRDLVEADVSALNHRDVIDADAKALNHRDLVDADVSALNHRDLVDADVVVGRSIGGVSDTKAGASSGHKSTTR